MAYYKLKNPRINIEFASIDEIYHNGKLQAVYLNGKFKNLSNGFGDGYNFKSVVNAKRYFTREYQSSKWGFEKPIWEQS